jgi:hypothetical protein
MLNNNLPKYSVNDIIQHNDYSDLKRKIIFIFESFYDETGWSKEIYYQTITIENNIPPTPMKESAIDKYYTKILS